MNEGSFYSKTHKRTYGTVNVDATISNTIAIFYLETA